MDEEAIRLFREKLQTLNDDKTLSPLEWAARYSQLRMEYDLLLAGEEVFTDFRFEDYLPQANWEQLRKDMQMGGKPSKGTPADKRLARNNPQAGKPKPKPVMPVKKAGK